MEIIQNHLIRIEHDDRYEPGSYLHRNYKQNDMLYQLHLMQ